MYLKGARLTHIESGHTATVAEDQKDPVFIKINWDRYAGQFEMFTADSFRLLRDDAAKDSPKAFKYKEGDRVKLKYNRSCGTIALDQQRSDAKLVKVIWDKVPGIEALEEVADLVTLHAPRDTDAVNPNQEAIDLIEVQRTKLKKEVEDLQSRLSTLTQAKRLLERG